MPAFKAWRALKDRAAREAQGLFLAEGEHLCREAVQEGKALAILIEEGAQALCPAPLPHDLPIHQLPARQFIQLCDTRTPQGIMALCALPGNAALSRLGTRIVCLNGLQDPGNVGTILRTMDAACFSGMLMDEASADAFSPKALRASMGAVFRIPVRVSADLPGDLATLAGFQILAGLLDGEPFYGRERLTGPLCLVIGSEGAGISAPVAALATHRCRLPMPGRAESLNAAVAAAIMMYDFVREWGS
ncbi:MAG: TrmH family RNA methyltransferase [Christensenellales bacterium]